MITTLNISSNTTLGSFATTRIMCIVSTASGNVTITLESATKNRGQEIIIRHNSASNTLTVSPQLGETIAGSSSYTSTTAGDVLTLVSDGTNYISTGSTSSSGGVDNPMTSNLDANGYNISNVHILTADSGAFANIDSPTVNAPGAVALVIDTPDAYTNSDAKLTQWDNNGTLKSYIDKDGNFSNPGAGLITISPSGGDDVDIINAAITALGSASGGVVQLVEGTYTINSDYIYLNSINNVELRGMGPGTIVNLTIPATNPATNPWGIYIEGQVYDYNISAPTMGDASVTTSTHSDAANFSAGDFVVLMGADSNGVSRLESAKVVSADGGTGVITLDHKVENSLSTSTQIRRVASGFNCKVTNMKIKRDATAACHNLGAIYTVGTVFENLILDGTEGDGGDGFTVVDNVDCVVKNVQILGFNTQEEYPIGNFVDPVGLNYRNNLRGKLLDCYMYDNGRSSVTYSVALALNSCLEDCEISRNIIENARNIATYWPNQLSLVGTTFSNNKILFPRLNSVYIAGSNYFLDSKISGNYFEVTNYGSGSFYQGIYNNTAPAYCRGLIISENNFKSIAAEAMFFNGLSNSVIANNSAVGCTVGAMLYLSSCSKLLVTGNQSVENHDGIILDACTYVAVTGNSAISNGAVGLGTVGAASNCVFSGNVSYGNGSKNFQLNNSSTNITVTGNDFNSTNVSYGTGGGHIISNNMDGGTVYTKRPPKPMFKYNSADATQVILPASTNNIAQVVIDGKMYQNTSNATMDLDTSGRGGLATGTKAANTVYYLYGIPASSGSTFDLVADTAVPSTGPTGFSAYTWLGSFRTDGSSNVPVFTYQGGRYTQGQYVDQVSHTGDTSETAKTVVASAIAHTCCGTVLGDGGAVGTCRVYGVSGITSPFNQPTVTTNPNVGYFEFPWTTAGTVYLVQDVAGNTVYFRCLGWIEDVNSWK